MTSVIRRMIDANDRLVWCFDDESVRAVTTAVLYDQRGAPILAPTAFIPLNRVPANPAAPVWTPEPGKHFRLMRIWLTASASGNILLSDGPMGPVIAVVPVLKGGTPCPIDLANGYLSAQAGVALYALGPAPGTTISGLVGGIEEDSGYPGQETDARLQEPTLHDEGSALRWHT